MLYHSGGALFRFLHTHHDGREETLVYVASVSRPTVDVTFESRLNPKKQLVWLCYSKFMGGSVPDRASHAGVSWLVVG
jgi:hypothetical protein